MVRRYNAHREGQESYMDCARGLGLALSICVLSASACALSDAPINYTSRTWQMQDGLPEETVQSFAQTKDRYLWIGTTGGLLRFDGERLVLFDRDNTSAFTDNNVFNLTVTTDDALWIATEGGGLIRYKDGVFRHFSGKDGLLNLCGRFTRTVRD
jgi:ligand-binding sensor domain-containing protein